MSTKVGERSSGGIFPNCRRIYLLISFTNEGLLLSISFKKNGIVIAIPRRLKRVLRNERNAMEDKVGLSRG